jgi:hypothetical protein
MLWLVLTFVAWLGVTIHDLALIGQTQKVGEIPEIHKTY